MALVLVVDDDAAAVEIRKLVLERHGHTVITATDAGVARTVFLKNTPDVVITDLRLPDSEDGLALIKQLRELRAARQLKIIVLCGNSADIEGREEAAMVDAILSKPVRSEALLRMMG